VMKVGGFVDPLKPDGQVELSRNLQIATAAIDSAGLCLFVAFAVLDKPEAFEAIYEMINAFYGLELDGDDVAGLGKFVLSTERKWNNSAGFTKQDDRLPYWMYTEKLAPHDTVFTVPDEEIDQFYDFVE
jgi:aldehyde:ferredoxin oxidoreductase